MVRGRVGMCLFLERNHFFRDGVAGTEVGDVKLLNMDCFGGGGRSLFSFFGFAGILVGTLPTNLDGTEDGGYLLNVTNKLGCGFFHQLAGDVLKDGETTTMEKALIFGALAYTVLPVSILPKSVFGFLGVLDEAGALLYVYKKVQSKITPDINRKVDELLDEWFGVPENAIA